jgi:hypothetical protein
MTPRQDAEAFATAWEGVYVRENFVAELTALIEKHREEAREEGANAIRDAWAADRGGPL